MARPRKARPEGAAASTPIEPEARDERTPQEYAAALDDALDFFKERDPDGWAELALCPLQHGVGTMIHKLRAMR